jgi:very-short-patch-repair endonuclease
MSEKRKIGVARALRRRETGVEYRLWQALRGRRAFGLKFRRQHPIGPYVADFACIEARLVVEIDGYWHATRKEKDAKRTAYLRGRGFDVVRFDIESESANIEQLAEAIAHEARQRVER